MPEKDAEQGDSERAYCKVQRAAENRNGFGK